MGQVMVREIYPLAERLVILKKQTETALTLAALQLALASIGVAWIPRSLAESDLALNRLIDMGDVLPQVQLSIVAQRLMGRKTPAETAVWRALADYISNQYCK